MNDFISSQICPNLACRHYGKSGDGVVAVHDKKKNRLRCKGCGKTWSAHVGQFYFGLHTNSAKVRRALEMLKAGLSIRKVARLTEVSAGTVMRWKKKLLNSF